jgi:hypothetical protein
VVVGKNTKNVAAKRAVVEMHNQNQCRWWRIKPGRRIAGERNAISSKGFIAKIKKELGVKAIHRQVYQDSKRFELHENESPYDADFIPQNAGLSHYIS